MKKISLIGGYGYKDVGDESQLTAVLMNMRKFIPGTHLIVLSDRLEDTREYHKAETDFSINHYLQAPFLTRTYQNAAPIRNSENVRDSNPLISFIIHALTGLKTFSVALILIFNAKRLKRDKKPLFLNDGLKHFLANLKSSTLLFDVGGGNLTSVWRPELRAKCLTFILCRIFEKPIILSGQTIGPFHGRLDRLIAQYAMNRVNLITLRERFSEKVLSDIGVTKPLIKVTADDSITLIPANPMKIRMVMANERIDVHRPLIGMNIIGLQYVQKSKTKFEKSKELLAKIADYLIDKHNATIIFVPMQYGTDDDRVPALETLQLMRHGNRAFILSQEYSDRVIKGVIGQMDLAIGFRYHFITFAVNSGVPAIGIYSDDYYSIKVNGILALVGQERYAISIEEATLERVIGLIEEIFSGREHIVYALKERTKILKKRSLTTIRYATKILSEQE